MRMNVVLIAMLMALLVVTACVPKIETARDAAAQDTTTDAVKDTADDTAAETTTAPSKRVVEPTSVETKPVLSNDMSVDTEARLIENFAPGVKIAVSHPTGLRMNIGDRMVLGAAFRSQLRVEDEFQMNFSLYRAYDKSSNSLLVDEDDIKNWMSASLLDGKYFGYPVEKLQPGEERKYKFIIDVKPTYADGTPTKPGTYEFLFMVYTKGTNYYVYEEHAQKKMSIQVLG